MSKKKLVIFNWDDLDPKIQETDLPNIKNIKRIKFAKNLALLKKLLKEKISFRIISDHPYEKIAHLLEELIIKEPVIEEPVIEESVIKESGIEEPVIEKGGNPKIKTIIEAKHFIQPETSFQNLRIEEQQDNSSLSKDDILYVGTQEASSLDSETATQCTYQQIEKSSTGRCLTEESYAQIYKEATADANANVEQPDVVFIGAGPSGLWTAIQFKLRHPTAKIVIKEKYEEFQRKHVLNLDPKSFAKAHTGNTELNDIIKDFKNRKSVPTSEIQQKFKEIAEKLNIKIENEQVESFEKLKEQYPNTEVFVDSSGTKNITEEPVFYVNGKKQYKFNEEVNHLVEIKYEATVKDPKKGRFLSKKIKTQLIKESSFPIFEAVGRVKENGKVPVSIRLFVDDATYRKLMNKGKANIAQEADDEKANEFAPTFKKPFGVQDQEYIPPNLHKAICACLKQREEKLGEEVDQNQISITAIPLFVSASKHVYKNTEDNKDVIKVGDSAFRLPYFRAFNAGGLLLGTKLAEKLSLYFKDKEAKKPDAKKHLQAYDEEFQKLANTEGRAAKIKNFGIKTYAAITHSAHSIAQTQGEYLAQRSPDYCYQNRDKFLHSIKQHKKSALLGSNLHKFTGNDEKSFKLNISIHPKKDNLEKAATILANIFKKYNCECLILQPDQTAAQIGWDGINIEDGTLFDRKHPFADHRGQEFRVLFRFGKNSRPIQLPSPGQNDIEPAELKALMLKAWRELAAANVISDYIHPNSATAITTNSNIITPFSYEKSSDQCNFAFDQLAFTTQDIVDNDIPIQNIDIKAKKEQSKKQVTESFDTIKSILKKIPTDNLYDSLAQIEAAFLEKDSIEDKFDYIVSNESQLKIPLSRCPLDNQFNRSKNISEFLTILDFLKKEQQKANAAYNTAPENKRYNILKSAINAANESQIQHHIYRIEKLFDTLIESKQRTDTFPQDEDWFTWLFENRESIGLDSALDRNGVITELTKKMEFDATSVQRAYHAFQIATQAKDKAEKMKDVFADEDTLKTETNKRSRCDIAFKELEKAIKEISDPDLNAQARELYYTIRDEYKNHENNKLDTAIALLTKIEQFIHYPLDNTVNIPDIPNELFLNKLSLNVKKFTELTYLKKNLSTLKKDGETTDLLILKRTLNKVLGTIEKADFSALDGKAITALHEFIHATVQALENRSIEDYKSKVANLIQNADLVKIRHLEKSINELTKVIEYRAVVEELKALDSKQAVNVNIHNDAKNILTNTEKAAYHRHTTVGALTELTNVLQKTKAAATSTTSNENTIKDFIQLRTRLKRNAVLKAVGGAMSCLIGSLLFTAAIAATITTVGVASPITIPLMVASKFLIAAGAATFTLGMAFSFGGGYFFGKATDKKSIRSEMDKMEEHLQQPRNV